MLRIDVPEVIHGLRSNQWASVAGIVLGLVILIVQAKRHHGLEPSIYRPGKEWVEPVALDSEDRIWLDEDASPDNRSETVEATATSDASNAERH